MFNMNDTIQLFTFMIQYLFLFDIGICHLVVYDIYFDLLRSCGEILWRCDHGQWLET